MLRPQKPISYLITSGSLTAATTSSSKSFTQILQLVEAAVAANVDLIQIREKELSTRALCELASQAAMITRASATRLLVNDRADVAVAAGADGVQLTANSLPAAVLRSTFGKDLLIGVSAHSLAEAQAAQSMQADFVVVGPVFETPSKTQYGPPLGLEQLRSICSELRPFPVLAIGGIDENNVPQCLLAGAQGIAAIRLFEDPARLPGVVEKIQQEQLCLKSRLEW